MGEFFAINSHEVFIWFSYVIGIGSLIALAAISWLRLVAQEAELKRLRSVAISVQQNTTSCISPSSGLVETSCDY